MRVVPFVDSDVHHVPHRREELVEEGHVHGSRFRLELIRDAGRLRPLRGCHDRDWNGKVRDGSS